MAQKGHFCRFCLRWAGWPADGVVMTTATDAANDAAVPAQGGSADPARAAWEASVLLAEHEAERLADELHNTLMQSLVVVRHAVGRAEPTAGDLPGADDLVRECLGETRRTVWHLRPRALEPGALPDAIGDLAARLRADHGFTLEHRTAVRRAASAARASVAYRLAQDLARAAVRAGAKRITVDLSEDPFGAIVVLHDGSAAVHEDATSSAWARRGDALGVRVERRP